MTNKEKLDALIKRRDATRDKVQLIKGKLESARQEKAKIEEECRKKGVEPDKLDDTIKQLQDKFESLLADMEQKIVLAEESLTGFGSVM